MRFIIWIILLFALAPFAVAETDNVYYVKEVGEEYSVLPGDELEITFSIVSKSVSHPEKVTAYIDPCPVGWTCASDEFYFDDDGKYREHPANLSVKVPKTARTSKYTMYVKLESEAPTSRGMDKVVVTVMTEEMAKTLTLEEYAAKQEEVVTNPAKEVLVEKQPDKAEAVSVPDEPVEAEVVPALPEEPVPAENKSELIENVEKLESNKQFVEYATIVLVVALVFIAGAAYISFKKED
ncbi:hypothetical protein ACFL3V_02155 [Nanoarchaeota archaeon]